MGFGSSKGKTKVELPPVTAQEISAILNLMQNKTKLARSKKVNDIKKKKDEIIDLLKNNNEDMAMAKMDGILRNEDLIAAYDILIPLTEILKERCTYIVSNSECPIELRAHLDTAIFSARRIEIEEYMKFRDLIQRKYGEAYISKADNNVDKLVDQNIVDKLGVNTYKDEAKKIRIRLLAKEKNINIKGSNLVPGGDWEVDIMAVNNQRNPYESMISNNQPNLPTQSFVQKHSGINNDGQGGFVDGFPRDDQFPSQPLYPSFNQKNPSPNNPFASINQGNQGQNNQFPSNFSQSNQGQNNQFPSSFSQSNQGQNNQFSSFNQSNQGQNNQSSPNISQTKQSQNNQFPPTLSQNNQSQNNQFPPTLSQNNQGQSNQASSFSQNNQGQNNPSMSNQSNINPTNSVSKSNNNVTNTNNTNNNIPPSNSGSNQPIEEKKENIEIKDDVFGKTVTGTVPVEEGGELPPEFGNPDDIFGNETKLKTQITENVTLKTDEKKEENIFGGETSKTIHLSGVDNPPKINPDDIFGGSTGKTMNLSVANPDNKENPFDNNPFGGETIKEEPKNVSIKTSGVNPFDQGANIPDPFGGQTLPVEEEEKKEENPKTNGADPFAPGAKPEDPFGGDTI